jgi:hypothetical protein
MFKFRLLASEVEAIQIGEDGVVEIKGNQLLGDANTWVIIDGEGIQTIWSDTDFRNKFVPADENAQKYLRRMKRK